MRIHDPSRCAGEHVLIEARLGHCLLLESNELLLTLNSHKDGILTNLQTSALDRCAGDDALDQAIRLLPIRARDLLVGADFLFT